MTKVNLPDLKARVRKIISMLKRAYPDAKCSLNHSNAFELLIATILSAQCTDARVNIVTQDLFRKYRKPEDYLKVSPADFSRTFAPLVSFATRQLQFRAPPKFARTIWR